MLSLGFGLHPHHANEFSERLLAEITHCLSSVPRSFVGEVGLELRPQYCEKIPFAHQLSVFRRMFELGILLNKCIQIHVVSRGVPGAYPALLE